MLLDDRKYVVATSAVLLRASPEVREPPGRPALPCYPSTILAGPRSMAGLQTWKWSATGAAHPVPALPPVPIPAATPTPRPATTPTTTATAAPALGPRHPGTPAALASAGVQGRPPAGVAAGDFEAVRRQLETELLYVQDAYIWFGNLRNFLTELFDEDQMSVELVADFLSLQSVDSNSTSIILEVFELVAALVGAVLAGVATGGSAAVGIASAVAGALSTAFSAGLAGVPGGGSSPDIQTQVAQLQDQLLEIRQQALRGNDLAQAAYLAHWPLLQALGAPIESLQVTWPLGQADSLAAYGRRGYELTLWRTLAPVAWSVGYQGAGSPTSSSFPQQYLLDLQCMGGAYDGPGWLYVTASGGAPGAPGLSRLFDPPNPDGTGPLAVPKADVYFGLGPWQLPNSGALANWAGGYGGSTGCVAALPPDPNSFRGPRQNPPVRSS